MKHRPWELRRQVLWLQTVTATVLIAMVWIVMVSRSHAQAVRDSAVSGLAAPSWWELVRIDLRSMLGIASLMLGIAIAGNALVTWRVRRATRGVGTQSLARMLDFYEGVLHAAREGLILLDLDGRVQLANDEALTLLGLRTVVPGTPLDDLHLGAPLAELLATGRTAYDELHLGARGVVVVNQQPSGRGRIVTLRDHTQLQRLLGELDAVRSLAESLQAQNHEASNRLHTVVSLIEIGKPERAREFAVSELQFAQAMTDRVVGTVGDPVLASLLLAKLSQAQERGVVLSLDLGHEALNTRLPAQDVVTVVGNLLDNAIEAARGGPAPRKVEFRAVALADAIDLIVTNTGGELGSVELARMFERGWTTKAEPGHGLGLVLVRSTVERWQGSLMVDPDSELDDVPALTVRVRLPRAVSASA
ncbi:sensor histidine kinase regulating citrate/malate metabolism [Kribbella aluminosa]|uniref:Sensor-like histidine kinase SenX3 n=1 Tax=Kribbella aluminosa TaxID=416017 RepID=A0ABS4UTB3_9ACTN|nr:ATP-binding protein [Kribbella aluminosa]MBP2354789.1 sensor histidine kinase regulating citrate/malate metabolism [Kribbella aluminosa]